MSDGDLKQFHGAGHAAVELSADERRSLRHLLYELDSNFVFLSDDDAKTLAIITPMRKVWWLFPIFVGIGVAVNKLGLI